MRSDIKLLVLKELSNSQALRAGVGKINPVRDAVLEKVQVLRPADAGNQHVNIMNLPGINLCQGAGKKIGLFLIIPFQGNAISRPDEGFQCLNDFFRAIIRPLANEPAFARSAFFLSRRFDQDRTMGAASGACFMIVFRPPFLIRCWAS